MQDCIQTGMKYWRCPSNRELPPRSVACVLGVRHVIRLKERGKPKVQFTGVRDVKDTFIAGTDLDMLLDEEVLLLSGKRTDVDGWVSLRIPRCRCAACTGCIGSSAVHDATATGEVIRQ